MPEATRFAPSDKLLSMDELRETAAILVSRGVNRIRLTGGEPLVRRGILGLVEALGSLRGDGLDELTMTTNGTQLAPVAATLFAGGIRRLNVSLDSLNAERFREAVMWRLMPPSAKNRRGMISGSWTQHRQSIAT
jgi:cyclic pyranopterin phosphate synthase